MKKTIFITIVVSLFTNALFAKANPKLVDEYLKVSGTKEIITALPYQIEKGYLENIDDKNLKQIDIKSNFDSKQTIKYFKSRLSKEFSDELLKKVIAYYKSPLGQKFKDNGIKAMRLKDLKKRAKFYKQLKKTPPSHRRLNVMNAFIDRLELTPVAVHLIGELLGAINAKLVMSNDSEKVIQSISYQIKDYMFYNSLYAYGDFTDKELKSVMEYYYTNAGRFEQIIVSSVFKELIMESFSQIMEQSQVKTANLN